MSLNMVHPVKLFDLWNKTLWNLLQLTCRNPSVNLLNRKTRPELLDYLDYDQISQQDPLILWPLKLLYFAHTYTRRQ